MHSVKSDFVVSIEGFVFRLGHDETNNRPIIVCISFFEVTTDNLASLQLSSLMSITFYSAV